MDINTTIKGVEAHVFLCEDSGRVDVMINGFFVLGIDKGTGKVYRYRSVSSEHTGVAVDNTRRIVIARKDG